MGRTIREARLARGRSLSQLAAAVGRSSSSVRRWERDEVPPAIGIIDELAARGKAILLVSSYLPELQGMAGRIAVMSRGELGPAKPVDDRTST